MPYLSHHRLPSTTPHYGMRPSANHRDAGTPSVFAVELHRARLARPESRRQSPQPPQRASTGLSPNGAVWPAALAIMLVANLATPAAAGIPRHTFHPADGDEAGRVRADTFGNGPVPAVDVPAPPAPSDVVARPVVRSVIKSYYTFHDFLRAVSAARAPFHYLEESVRDAYETLSGQEVNPDVSSRLQAGADTVDRVTGVLPEVGLLRLPGQLADMMSNGLEGKAVDPEKLFELMQYADPRTLGAAPRIEEGPTIAQAVPGHRVHEARPEPNAEPISPIGENHEPDAPDEPGAPDAPDVPGEREESEAPGSADSGRATPLGLARPRGQATAPARVAPLHIIGEHEHLRGYEQQLPPDQLPVGEPSSIVVVNGHHYLKGEAGYYRAERGISADHWRVDAPRGGEARAQVPVTYDASTGEWHADSPLRLCGGGCAASTLAYPPDSIVGSLEDIVSTVSRITNERAQDAIKNAFLELSELHLRRTNRADLHGTRDNSIVNHRAALRIGMAQQIDPKATLIKQQCHASSITAGYYEWNVAAEAFCQENAEILFHSLLSNGISRNNIRMLTIKPQNRPPHVIVLYTESEHFIELMDRSTPQPPLPGYNDGIGHDLFRESAYLTRDSTVFLDPWSTMKATSFGTATSRIQAGYIINRAFRDIGHTPGNAYRVSVTRPLGPYRADPRSPAPSPNSDSQSSHSMWDVIKPGASLSSADTGASRAAGASSSS